MTAPTMTRPIGATDVKRANRRLYDAVAGAYEMVDGRRNPTLAAWLRNNLERLAAAHGRGVLLDIGSGCGFVTRAADGIFDRTIALDLSPRLLAESGPIATHRIAADADVLPIASGSVNVVTCFAVIHHLFDTASLAREVARVLRPGGGFWSDHDMDAAFHDRFRWSLGLYRRLRGARHRYTHSHSAIDDQTYELAEFHESGVRSDNVARQFRDAGLQTTAAYHWFGLSTWANRLFGCRELGRGWAPLLRILATKSGGSLAEGN